MKKVVIFAFKGDPMCFVHVLLNARDMHERGIEAKIVIEGESVKLLQELEQSKNPLYLEVKELGLIHSICKACSIKMNVAAYNETLGIKMLGDMAGHVAMSTFINDGYEVITL